MKKLWMLFLAISTFSSFAQEDSALPKEKLYEARKQLREGNKYYRTNRLEDAAIAYQKSMVEDGTYYKGAYNLGNAFFQQQKYKEAAEQYELANKLAKTKEDKAKTSELIGDSYKKQNDLEKALAAYKQGLLKNPGDDILREKFVAAKQEKQKQDQQNKDDENKDNQDQDKDNKDDQKDNKEDNKDDQNKDKEGDKDKKDDKGKDKDDKNKDNKGDEEKDDENKNGDNKDQGDKGDEEKEQPSQPKESKLSPQQIQQLLESMNNEEQKTQEKVNAQKVKVKANNNEKDW